MKHSAIFHFVGLAMLTALVVVLQTVGGGITFGGFSITLVLIPVVIGSALFGAKDGAFLGGVFGLIVYINCANGTDMGGNMVFAANPYLCALVCIGKGILSGFVAGLMYRWIHGALTKRQDGSSNGTNGGVGSYLAVLAAAIIAPIVNTGTFILGMLLFFKDTLDSWAGGTPIVSYVIFGLTGVNFLIELGVNILLAPAITTIINVIRKKH